MYINCCRHTYRRPLAQLLFAVSKSVTSLAAFSYSVLPVKTSKVGLLKFYQEKPRKKTASAHMRPRQNSTHTDAGNIWVGNSPAIIQEETWDDY